MKLTWKSPHREPKNETDFTLYNRINIAKDVIEPKGLKSSNHMLLWGWLTKKSTVFKKLTPRSRTYELRSQGEKSYAPNQDKQTPHTVLQKLFPKKIGTHLRYEVSCDAKRGRERERLVMRNINISAITEKLEKLSLKIRNTSPQLLDKMGSQRKDE